MYKFLSFGIPRGFLSRSPLQAMAIVVAPKCSPCQEGWRGNLVPGTSRAARVCACMCVCIHVLCEGALLNETRSLFQILQLHQRSHHAPEPPATWAALPASAAPGTATTRASRWARSWLCSGLLRMSLC